ncbi:MAG: hypothetical protein ACQ5SW_07945 [Sphaerochaetaceae bacterium]
MKKVGDQYFERLIGVHMLYTICCQYTMTLKGFVVGFNEYLSCSLRRYLNESLAFARDYYPRSASDVI